MKKTEKGFTLIELLVVIAILGVLATIALPNIIGMITSGNVAAANSELATVQTAVDAYMTDKNVIIAPTPSSVLNPYLRGNFTSIKGIYKVEESGIVWPDQPGQWAGIVANATIPKWDKAN